MENTVNGVWLGEVTEFMVVVLILRGKKVSLSLMSSGIGNSSITLSA